MSVHCRNLFSGWCIPKLLLPGAVHIPPSYSPDAWQFRPVCYTLGLGSPGFHNLKGSELEINTTQQVQASRHKWVWKTDLQLSGEYEEQQEEGRPEHFHARLAQPARPSVN